LGKIGFILKIFNFEDFCPTSGTEEIIEGPETRENLWLLTPP